MSDLTYISIAPYFILMACFAGIARCFDFENPKTEVLTPHGDRFNVPLESLRGVLALGVFFHHAVTTLFFYKTGKWGQLLHRFIFCWVLDQLLCFFF